MRQVSIPETLQQQMKKPEPGAEILKTEFLPEDTNTGERTFLLPPSEHAVAPDADALTEANLLQAMQRLRVPGQDQKRRSLSLDRASAASTAESEISESKAGCPSPYGTGAVAAKIYVMANALKQTESYQTDDGYSLLTEIQNSLGGANNKGSKAFGSIAFEDGGGCIIKCVKRQVPTEEELQEQLRNAQEAWDQKQARAEDLKAQGKPFSKMKSPRPTSVNDLNPKVKTVTREIELHPPGGMHGGYKRQQTPRGSYVRIKSASGQEKMREPMVRFARHGWFDAKQSYNHRDLGKIKPGPDYQPKLVSQNENIAQAKASADDIENFPDIAHRIMETLFAGDLNKVQGVFVALSEDRPWHEVLSRAAEFAEEKGNDEFA